MASRPLPARCLALLAAAVVAAGSLASGLTGFAPAEPARADGPFYPSLDAVFLGSAPTDGSGNIVASAGIVNLADPPEGGPALPNPASVTAAAGPSPLQGAAILRTDLSATELGAVTLDSLHLETLPAQLPLSTMPIRRSSPPTSWEDVLAPTVLAGIPLQNVTWSQVDSLTGAGRPAILDTLSMADIDWSGSILAEVPLAAFTFGGATLPSIDIPLQPSEPAGDTSNAQRWCYLLNQAQPGSCAGAASLTGQTLLGVSLRGAPLKNIPLKNIPLKNIDLATSPLKNIPLKNIVLQVSPLKNIPLKNIDMAGAPLKNIPLANILLDAAGVPTVSPLKNIPLKNIAWASSPLKNIPLKNIDLATSPLKNIPLKNIDFSVAPLKNIPLKNIDLATSPLKNIPLKNIDFSVAPLKNIPLKNIDLATSPLKNIPLKNIAATGAPLKNIPLKNIDFSVAPLKNIALKNIDLAASGLGSLPLASVSWTAAPLGARLASDFVTTGVPFASAPAAGSTLAQVAAASGFTAGATLASLLATLKPGAADVLLGDIRLDLAGVGAPAVTLAALLGALSAVVPDPVLGDLGTGTLAGLPTLGDVRLDLLADTGITVGDLLAELLPAATDVLLGDLRIDAMASAPATTVGELLAIILPAQADVLLGDLRLDLATGVDTIVLDAITAFLLDPATFAGYLLGALGTWTDVTGHDITLGELGLWEDQVGNDITLGDLAQYLDDSVSLADVLLGLVPAADFPFENFPIDSLGLNVPGRQVIAAIGGGSSTASPINLTFRLLYSYPFAPSDPVKFVALLPAGSRVTSTSTYSGANPEVAVVPKVTTAPDGRVRVEVPVGALAAGGTLGGVRVSLMDGLHLGPQPIDYSLVDPSGATIQSANYNFISTVDGAEPNTPLETIPQGLPGFARIPNVPYNAGGCSALDASCAGRSSTLVDAMLTGYVSHPGDVDWYQIQVVRAGSRITADLTDLPFDADLVLYGPAGIASSPSVFPNAQGLPGRFVEDPGLGVGRAASAVAAESLTDLQLDRGYHDPLAGDVDVPAMTPLSISQHHGTDPESVGVIAPVNGTYVIAVSGYNGASGPDPYLVRARVTVPTTDASCAARSFPNPMPAAGAIPPVAADANVVFLTNPSRLSATYGPTGAADVATRLSNLVAWLSSHPALGFRAAVVPVDAYPGVRAAYDTWDSNPCSVTAANAVASGITGVLQAVRASSPGVTYVTLVGGDDILPMGRVPDLTRISNESDYASTFGPATNPLSAAQKAGFMLTDDAYGDPSPTPIGNGSSLFVPRLAVGRLVETPSEIGGLLDAYSTKGGTLDSGTGLVAGYDFLSDGASTVAGRLTTGGRTVDGALIDAPGAATPWTRADLLAKLFPAGGPTPLVDSINAHYDHTALLPSAGNAGGSGELLTTEDVAALSTADRLLGRLLFTMGCHAGLAVPDAYVPGTGAAADALRLDWAQALASAKVAVYVANTGFGIGDTSSVAYSERLMGLYARLLDGSLTAGQALAYAKQAYYGSLGAIGVYDFKILQQAAFYGLPFWRIDTTGVPPAPPTAPALPGTIAADASTGLQAMSWSLTPGAVEAPPDARGRSWTIPGFDPQVTHYRPIEPRITVPVGTAGLLAHGVLITSLTSHDVPNVNPVVDTPTIDLSGSSPEAPSIGTAWPARPATITTYQAPFGQAQDLVLVPGQFLGGTGSTGTQRLFDAVGLKVYYAPAATSDTEPPAILGTNGTAAGTAVTFTVATNDAAGTVQRVLVGYHDFDDSWHFVDLAHGVGDAWSGAATASHAFGPADEVEYFVQVLDAAGNVASVSNKAQNFAARIQDGTPPTITAAITPAPNAQGWVTGASATVTFTCTDAGSGIAAGACPGPVLVTADGTTVVPGSVVDQAGNPSTVTATVNLDGSAPAITATVDPSGWSNAASATVTFSCSDGVSGVDATGCPAPVTVTGEGATDVSRTVHDVAGNAASVTATVRLDRASPSISAAISPPPNAAGWNRGASATVSFTCSDALSGLAPGACPAAAVVTAEGVRDVAGNVLDRAGNLATATARVRLDRTAPSVSFSGSGTTYACVTTDALSGVATAATLARTTARVNGIPMTTATCSGAKDVAGNAAAPVSAPPYVAPMTWSGYLLPAADPPWINIGKAGWVYAIRFRLWDAQGSAISALPAVTGTTYQAVTCPSGTSTSDQGAAATGPIGLRYDNLLRNYLYVWATPTKKGCYAFRLTLADGSTHIANFNLK